MNPTIHQAEWGLLAALAIVVCAVAVTAIIRAMMRRARATQPVEPPLADPIPWAPPAHPNCKSTFEPVIALTGTSVDVPLFAPPPAPPATQPLIDDIDEISDTFIRVREAMDGVGKAASDSALTVTQAMSGLAEAVERARRDSGRVPNDPRVPEHGKHVHRA